jgi:hypothetical protein
MLANATRVPHMPARTTPAAHACTAQVHTDTRPRVSNDHNNTKTRAARAPQPPPLKHTHTHTHSLKPSCTTARKTCPTIGPMWSMWLGCAKLSCSCGREQGGANGGVTAQRAQHRDSEQETKRNTHAHTHGHTYTRARTQARAQRASSAHDVEEDLKQRQARGVVEQRLALQDHAQPLGAAAWCACVRVWVCVGVCVGAYVSECVCVVCVPCFCGGWLSGVAAM